MARPALMALALAAVALAVTACDRLPRRWPFGAAPNSVTVKLPPARPIGTRGWGARLDFAPEPAFGAALLALLPPPRAGAISASPTDPHGNATA